MMNKFMRIITSTLLVCVARIVCLLLIITGCQSAFAQSELAEKLRYEISLPKKIYHPYETYVVTSKLTNISAETVTIAEPRNEGGVVCHRFQIPGREIDMIDDEFTGYRESRGDYLYTFFVWKTLKPGESVANRNSIRFNDTFLDKLHPADYVMTGECALITPDTEDADWEWIKGEATGPKVWPIVTAETGYTVRKLTTAEELEREELSIVSSRTMGDSNPQHYEEFLKKFPFTLFRPYVIRRIFQETYKTKDELAIRSMLQRRRSEPDVTPGELDLLYVHEAQLISEENRHAEAIRLLKGVDLPYSKELRQELILDRQWRLENNLPTDRDAPEEVVAIPTTIHESSSIVTASSSPQEPNGSGYTIPLILAIFGLSTFLVYRNRPALKKKSSRRHK